jgi:hypothetical protein
MNQNNSLTNLENEMKELRLERDIYKKQVEFYKSLFITHRNSVVHNLTIKKRKCKKVWIDPINDNREKILDLDMDDDVEEWLKPTKCER